MLHLDLPPPLPCWGLGGFFFPSLYILGVCKEASVFPRRLLLHLHVKCGFFTIRCRGCFPSRRVPAPRWRGWLGAGAAVAPRRNAASVNKARPSACCLYLISTFGNFLWGCWTNRREMNHEKATSPWSFVDEIVIPIFVPSYAVWDAESRLSA